MYLVITLLTIGGFLGSLFIMYNTEHGIPGIKKYDQEFKLLDMRFRYNSNILYNTFEIIGKEGRNAYKKYLIVDFIFIFFFLVLKLLISFKITNSPFILYILIFFVVIRAVFDIIENTILIFLLNISPKKNYFWARICSWVTTFKFIALYLWLISIVILTTNRLLL